MKNKSKFSRKRWIKKHLKLRKNGKIKPHLKPEHSSIKVEKEYKLSKRFGANGQVYVGPPKVTPPEPVVVQEEAPEPVKEKKWKKKVKIDWDLEGGLKDE
jgi:hypothetical protein